MQELANPFPQMQHDPSADYVPLRDYLCAVCAVPIFQSPVLDEIASSQPYEQSAEEIWPHHISLAALLLSARQGCHLCSLLYVQCCSTTFEYPSDVVPTGQLTLGIKWKHLSSRLLIGIYDLEGSLELTSLSLCEPWLFRPDEEEDGPWRTNSTSSAATIDLASKWLASCRSNHKDCSKQGVFSEDHPKRLLELFGGHERPSIRLREAVDLPSGAPYITLSHCWGSKPILKLTQANYQSFVQGLPFVNLSQTFQDAIQVTWRLGFNCLWIDALCIIQDDPKDIKDEIPRMGTIYGNCVFTIAALSSQGGDGGCFADRLPLANIACQSHTRSGHRLGLKSERIGGIMEQLDPNNAMGSRYCPNLHSRAWVVQERSLSPRTLYFSRVGVHWECCTMTMSEDTQWEQGESPGFSSFQTGRLKYGVSKILRNTETARDITATGKYSRRYEIGNWHDQWWHLVSIYTRCKLTHISDRWPAISGLATMFQKATASHTVAGLWVSRLHNDILWEAGGHGPDDTVRSRLDNGYPTWSWISVNSPVNLDDHALSLTNENCVAKIVSIPNPPPSSKFQQSQSSQTAGGHYIEIEAPMLKIPKKEELKRRVSNSSNESSEYEWVPENSLLDVLKRELSKGAWRADVPCNPEDDDEDKWSWTWMSAADMWALQWTKDNRSTRMLIVRPLLPDHSKWCRVGHFHFWPDEPGDEMSIGDIGERTMIKLY